MTDSRETSVLHRDLFSVAPLAGTRTFLNRIPHDHPLTQGQVGEGWATYMEMSEPHTMDDCPVRHDA